MTGCEDPEFAQLDAYFRTQLAEASESYAISVDLDAKLKATLATGTSDDDDAVAANS